MTPDGAPRDRASLLTPVGRGAVSVIAAVGPAALAAVDAHFRAANGLPLRDQPINRILFGHWTAGGEHREEVIVCRTAAWSLEVHCHGGVAAAERILAALAEAGSRVVLWGEWVRQHAGCALAAEADVALAAAATQRTAAILLDQRQGALRAEIEKARSSLASLDASDHASGAARIEQLLARSDFGLHLSRPWRIAIAGRPNVGKSSLINAAVGYQRAIVFDQPGTTRDVLTAQTAIEGWPVRLADMAGLRAAVDPLEAAGVSLARNELARADVVVWVLDATALTSAERADPIGAAFAELAVDAQTPLRTAPLVVINKIDRVAEPLPSRTSPGIAAPCVAVSALTGAGLSELLTAIARRLVPGAPAPGEAVPFTERHVALLGAALTAVTAGSIRDAATALDRLLAGNDHGGHVNGGEVDRDSASPASLAPSELRSPEF
jgi:tRNA modification GTPase